MTDVQELQARIAKLSAEIDLQKDVLKKLEQDKSLIQRQLNTVLDPVARLPFEISSEIFLQCLPLSLFPPNPNDVPILLLNVCSAWTDIAFSTPGLWTAIKITLPRAHGFEDSLQAWLRRAANHPLSISLIGPETFDRSVMGIIWEHGQQLQHLEMSFEEEDERDDYGTDDRIDFLGGQSREPLPLLETLRIRNLTWHHAGFLPWNCLTLPALEALSLQLHDETIVALFDFLKRSSPPLKQLGMRDITDTRDGFDFVRLQECFYLVPTLTDLTL
ncbi:hypothetical protein B0H19DRAFT_1261757 [Mycena capillaripes]|nr:hypothetical protein B0H19DRAFT_1261757 [Mycena capillaripes]